MTPPKKGVKKKSEVAVLRTNPGNVIKDYKMLLELAGVEQALPKGPELLLKINISWQKFYPACSTTPWQLDGVIEGLLELGYSRESLTGAHNRTVVVDAKIGEVNNKHKPVLDRHKVRNIHLYEPEEDWFYYSPKSDLLALDRIFPDGIMIPKRFPGTGILHLPTVKTHVFTTMTGAMKNAFGGLLNENRHWAHSDIHEVLVDLLTIQKEIHEGVFAVTDGTIAGDGPGPRCMDWKVKNVILASSDPVAIDSVAARMMGFDPMKLKFLALAHEKGLGNADPSMIKITGDEEAASERWNFTNNADTFASRGQKAIYWGPLRPLEGLLLRSPLVPWSYLASRLYHDVYWYNVIGKHRVDRFMKTKWGKLFKSY
ncbi:MAG: DUF362 domain-containing protein [Deltaproteobacteria bacterium]|nr:DUF362 domain-containing protein [Deltaproteobacteria bacterium]